MQLSKEDASKIKKLLDEIGELARVYDESENHIILAEALSKIDRKTIEAWQVFCTALGLNLQDYVESDIEYLSALVRRALSE